MLEQLARFRKGHLDRLKQCRHMPLLERPGALVESRLRSQHDLFTNGRLRLIARVKF
jgi:hypothetical protein